MPRVYAIRHGANKTSSVKPAPSPRCCVFHCSLHITRLNRPSGCLGTLLTGRRTLLRTEAAGETGCDCRRCCGAGKFPLLTVQTIVNIAAQAERVFDHRYHFDLLMEQSLYAGDMGASPAGVCLCPDN